MAERYKDTKFMAYYRVDSAKKSRLLKDSSHHKTMKTKQYFKQTVFSLMR